MFRKEKEVTERSKSFLKNKEVRNLRQHFIDISLSTFTAEQCQEILPEKGNVTVARLMNKTLLYSVLEIPYFFDLHGRSDYYPTIFTLFKFPHMIRQVVIYEPVAEYLLNGADLMLPGVAYIPDLHTLRVGEVVSVRIVGNPIPFAVGKSEIDGQMVDVLRQDNHVGWKKGKCVSIVQIFGDLLWQHCRDHLRGAQIPGVSDPMTLVYPNPGFSRQSLSITSIEQELPLHTGNQVGCVPEVLEDPTDKRAAVSEDDSIEKVENPHDVEDLRNFSGQATETLNGPDDPNLVMMRSIPPETMDNLLLICLLRTLKYLVKDKDFPMLTSAFWSIVTRAVIPNDAYLVGENTPGDIKLDIKHSSYKKTLPFLKHLQAVGLLTLVNDRVAVVNRQHEYFRDLKDQIRVENPEEFRIQITSPSNDQTPSHSNKVMSDSSTRLKIIDLFKFPRPIREVLISVVRNGGRDVLTDLEDHLSSLMGEGPYGECMVHSEVQWLIASYVLIQNLQDTTNKGSLIIPVSDPLYPHVARIKGIEKQKASSASINSDNNVEVPCTDDDVHPLPPPDDQLYQMVGGVLVTPFNRLTINHSSSNSTSQHDFETVQHTPAKWKPVTLPPAPPPSSRTTNPHQSLHQSQIERKPKKEKVVHEPVLEDLHITKEDFMYRLRNALVPYHALLLPTGELTVATGAAPKILIEAEVRSGNKVVTRMSGLEIYGLNSQQCAKEFQRKFACSATVGPAPTRPKELEIIVQGNWISELEEYLKSFCDIPSKLIETKKLQKKKKK